MSVAKGKHLLSHPAMYRPAFETPGARSDRYICDGGYIWKGVRRERRQREWEVVETDLVRRLAQSEPQPLLHLCRREQEGARSRRAKGW